MMEMEKESFGVTKDGEEVFLYTLVNSNGMKAKITNYGAILVRLYVPDRSGKMSDVVLGYDKLADYEENPCFFGSTIAPNANRIAGAEFTIDGMTYHLDANEGNNNLHSHFLQGAHKRVWKAKQTSADTLELTMSMKDGELGFPGNKVFRLTYCVTEDQGLKISYQVTSDKKTVINPTNHSYFNLAGHDAGSILNHRLQLFASNFTPVGAGSIPTGEIKPVKGTPMDFTKSKGIGEEIDSDDEQLNLTGGYDHNYVIDGWDNSQRLIAEVYEEISGRAMEVYTDLPGVQFYAGNYITPIMGKDGARYDKRHALCLETDYFPDSVNHNNFPAPIFGGEKGFASTTIYRFTTK